MADLPGSARAVVIGGGAVGCSVLYHLAEMGWTDSLLLERNELTSGSTWHAAGNCPNFSASWTIMKMQSYSTALYRRLGEAVDYPINYHVTGSIRLAHSRERMQEFRHVLSIGRQMGVEFEMLDSADMKALYPFLETHDLEGGIWDPTDGDIDPAQLTQALARGARNMGARIVRFCPVNGVRRENGEWVVETGLGEVRCEVVVNAAGYRAHEVGAMFGRRVPCVALAHQYLVTDEIEELKARETKLPLLRDPDSSYYLRQEKNGLLLGPYEKNCRAHWISADDPMPVDFSFQLYPDDLDRLEWYIEDACARVPILGSVGVTSVVNGPIPYAPDGNPLIGPMPGVPNAYEACVLTFGIVQAGGAGRICAEWIAEGETETDCWAVDPRRFTDHVTRDYAIAKAIEVYSHEYATHFPAIQWPAGRPAKTSPLYPILEAKGAEFGAYGGWERAEWFPRPGDERGPAKSYDRQHWFDAVGEECHHVAAHVGLLDLPGFTRFEVSGPRATEWLETIITGNLPSAGRVGLVYFATPKGRVLSEMTLTRFDRDRYWLMTGAGAAWHDRDWLLSHLPGDGSVALTDISNRWSTLVVTGPKARAVMAAACETEFGNEAFAWLAHRPIEIGMARGHALRVSYAGELGWEVHVPVEYTLSAYDRLWTAGGEHDMRDFGVLALDSMRLEKGYRAWKADLSNDYTMLESGLEGWLRFDKPAFVGRDALLAKRAKDVGKTFVTLVVDEGADVPFGDAVPLSTVFARGQPLGLVLSAGYGHRVGASIALAIIDRGHAAAGTRLEIEIVGEMRGAVVAPHRALYDPDNTRLRS